MKKIIKILLIVFCIGSIVMFLVNFYVINCGKNKIITKDDYSNLKNIDCIIVLGAGVRDNKPSHMLEDRLLTAIELYDNGISSKIIMSGDHGQKEYDEVNIMKEYAIKAGIPSEDIFMDHAGFSTYESIYRAKEIFEVNNAVIVTQEYHLYRALYIADQLGIDALGVTANSRIYSGQLYRELREILARNKDFLNCIFQPKPTYLGEAIPVKGNGDITNDK